MYFPSLVTFLKIYLYIRYSIILRTVIRCAVRSVSGNSPPDPTLNPKKFQVSRATRARYCIVRYLTSIAGPEGPSRLSSNMMYRRKYRDACKTALEIAPFTHTRVQPTKHCFHATCHCDRVTLDCASPEQNIIKTLKELPCRLIALLVPSHEVLQQLEMPEQHKH